MNVKPTGARAADGALELRRDFKLGADELWAYLTESAKTTRWIGPWRGDPRRGSVELSMSAEPGAPVERAEVLQCDPATRRLAVRLGEGEQAWHLELAITPGRSGAELLFRMPTMDPKTAAYVGPGWEYYLDRLVAAVVGGDPGSIRFEPDYFPALADYYEALFSA